MRWGKCLKGDVSKAPVLKRGNPRECLWSRRSREVTKGNFGEGQKKELRCTPMEACSAVSGTSDHSKNPEEAVFLSNKGGRG